MKHCRYKDKNDICQHREGLFYGLANLCQYCEAGEDYKVKECTWYCEEKRYSGGIQSCCGRCLPDSLEDCEGICKHFHRKGEKW